MAIPIPPMLKEKYLLIMMDRISVPPREPLFLIIMPVPAPDIRPPKIAATIEFSTFKAQFPVKNRKREELMMPRMVKYVKRFPRKRKLPKNKGMLSMITEILRYPKRYSSIMAIPVTPLLSSRWRLK